MCVRVYARAHILNKYLFSILMENNDFFGLTQLIHIGDVEAVRCLGCLLLMPRADSLK